MSLKIDVSTNPEKQFINFDFRIMRGESFRNAIHIFFCILHHLRVYYELTHWPAPRRLDLVGRALHRYRRGHKFDSCSGLNFFQALISQLLKLCS